MDNINSQLIDKLKKDLMANGCYLFYIKNSLARKALEMRETDWNKPESILYPLYKEIGHKDIKGLDKLKESFREINGCIFANGNLSKVAELIDRHTLASNGYSGYISEIVVKVPAGPTNIDIKMTNFFQKQNIPTKVENKKIKIEKEVILVNVGEPVNGTHLKIIELLELCPFSFKVQIKKLWDRGNLFGKEVV
jgi:ribosomal protein L10